MALDSTESGYLLPTAQPDYDLVFDRTLHDAIVGVTGIPGDLVRPRWQPDVPNQPDFTVDWCAFGVVLVDADVFAYEGHDPAAAAGIGASEVQRDELLHVLHSFYGPNCGRLSSAFRAGLSVGQNRDALRAAGVGLVEVQDAVQLPALLQQQWVKRIDVRVVYRRRTSHAYQIRNVETGVLGIDNELYLTPIEVTN